MRMGAIVAKRIAGLALAICPGASAQSLIEAERIAEVRQAFASPDTAARLRCSFAPERPSLHYDLEFHTGYSIGFPLGQLAGSEHEVSVLLRVTPEGGDPVYLGRTEGLPKVPAGKFEGELVGDFIIGEGAYSVDAHIRDESGPLCLGKWRVQARRTGGERELRPATPPSSVREDSDAAAATPVRGGPAIERLTVLLHAAALDPLSAKIDDSTARMLQDSLASLCSQLPSRSVRLVMFNLEQQAVLMQKDGFTAADLPQVSSALEQLELARVDYRALQNRDKVDLLTGLVEKERRDPHPASAVIFLGPRAASNLDAGFQPDAPGAAQFQWFYLQYEGFSPVQPFGRRGYGLGTGGPDETAMSGGSGRGGRRGTGAISPPADRPAPREGPDGIEQLLRRVKGETIAVRTPHAFAGALVRMRSQIPASAVVPEPATQTQSTGTAGPAPAPQAAAAAPAPQDNPVEVLIRLRDHVLQHGRQVPNYTCVETVQRDRYEPAAGRMPKSCDTLLAARKLGETSLRLNATDWLRLDVGLARDREIYSWAGAPRFEEKQLDEIVPEGATGTGPFAAMLLSVFENRDTHFLYDGDRTIDGKRVLAYSFRIAEEDSHYQVKTRRKEWIITAYSGELLVDPKTAELVRLNVRTDPLPDSTGSCEIDSTLEYGLVPLGSVEYLLPRLTRQRFIGRLGEEAENRVQFSACREYQGESTISFGETAAGAPSAAPKISAPALPPSQIISVEVAAPVQLRAAAAGDRIAGWLATEIHDAQGKVAAPEGAKLEGRLMRVELRPEGAGELTVALRWETIELHGAKVSLSLDPYRPMPDKRSTLPDGLRRRGVQIELPNPSEEHFGVYHFPARQERIESGFRTDWITTAR
jgi:hypothetical protein